MFVTKKHLTRRTVLRGLGASLVLPHPWPTVIALIVGLVILLWALDAAA